MLVEVDVPLGLGANAVSMAVAELGAGEVPLCLAAPAYLTPPSSMLRPFLVRPFYTYYIHIQRTHST
jgi:hypothetical protein